MNMADSPDARRPRLSSNASVRSATNSIRSATERIMDSDPPLGMWAATAEATSKAPTLGEIRRGSFGQEGWHEANQRSQRRRSSASGESPVGGRRPSAGRRTSSGTPRVGTMRRSSTGMSGDGHVEGISEIPEKVQEPYDTLTEEPANDGRMDSLPTENHGALQPQQSREAQKHREMIENKTVPDENGEYPNGYIEPPKKPWTESTAIGLRAFWKWFLTPLGFGITIYGLNVVAWGGMLFLLLCGAAPAMCSQNTAANNYDGCNDIDSPRRVWIEIDSQILNGLFCVTGFGLIPWRFRDLYWLMRFRLCNERKKGHAAKMVGIRMLAGIHRGWFRLPGSDTLDEMTLSQYEATLKPIETATTNSSSSESAISNNDSNEVSPSHKIDTDQQFGLAALPESDERIPLPITKAPDLPLTGVRAPPTTLWKMDFVIWCNVWNTFLQTCLCGFMWGMNRYKRPSWSTGFFIACACVVAGVGGIVMFKEGKKVKKVEGVPVKTEQRIEDAERDVEAFELREQELVKGGQKTMNGSRNKISKTRVNGKA